MTSIWDEYQRNISWMICTELNKKSRNKTMDENSVICNLVEEWDPRHRQKNPRYEGIWAYAGEI